MQWSTLFAVGIFLMLCGVALFLATIIWLLDTADKDLKALDHHSLVLEEHLKALNSRSWEIGGDDDKRGGD